MILSRPLRFLALAGVLGSATPLQAQLLKRTPVPRTDSLTTLDETLGSVQRRLAQESGDTVGFYFRDLVKPESILIDADTRFHAASTMKVPVLIQVFRDIDAGRFGLHDKIIVTNDFHSLADSSVFHLDRADDSDSSLYLKIGLPVEVEELATLMITKSSNLATNILIDKVGASRVQATLHELGADSVRVLRGVEDTPAFRAGMNNTTTARGMARVLASIVDATAASPQSCGTMVGILQHQTFNDGIPAGLPRHTRVAHKTGWFTGVHHDAAIVYWDGRPRYILVIMTRGIPDQSHSATLMADLARIIQGHVIAPPQPRFVPHP
ncbi:MAG TPA: serine hydrolase [Gemmatimonadales bacterium]